MVYKSRATKLDILRFIRKNDVIEIMDLVTEFGYSYGSAKVTLIRLEKRKVVEKLGTRACAYCLSNEGTRKVEYYD
ncbi:hypothetical protein KKH23_05405 [Patescibacteria group bacterium]|nr:hypothetical protein [Patescibacteria group bacterium]